MTTQHTDRELMQQALEALVQIHPGNMTPMAEEAWNKAIVSLGERLAQPDPMPLTDEEIDAEWRELDGEASALFKRVIRKFARAIEAKLKEKNNG